MADRKNIEIKIAATGGDQAAGEIRKVSDAEKDYQERKAAFEARRASGAFDKNAAGSGEVGGMGGMLEHEEKLREAREKAHAERIAQIEKEKAAIDEQARIEKKALDDELAGMREKEKAAAAYAEKLDTEAADQKALSRKKEIGIAIGAIGTAAAIAAKSLSNVYEELESIDTANLKTVDAAFAEQIENAKKFKEALADPIGALAALANGGTTLKESVAGLNEQLKLNAEGQAAAIDRLIAKAGVNVGEIRKLAGDLKTANELLSSKEELAAVQRDGKAAEAVRNGVPQENVDAELATAAAADKIAEIERRQNEVRAEENPQKFFDSANDSRAQAAKLRADQERRAAEAEALVKQRAIEGKKINPVTNPLDFKNAVEKYGEARANRDAIASDKAPADAIKRLEAQAVESQKAFEAAQKKIRETDEQAAVEKQIIREGLSNTVTGLGAKKQDRLAEESRNWKDVGDGPREAYLKEQEKNRAEALRDDRQRQGATNQISGGLVQGAFNAAKDAKGMGAPARGIESLERAAAALSKDPENNARQEAVERLLEQVLNYLDNNGNGNTADTAKIRDLERKFEQLKKKNKLQ